MTDVKETIRAFIAQNFLVESDVKVGDGDSLLQLQIVDSTGFLELVNFLEATFGIKVADEEMVPENLETIDNMAQYLARKRGN